MDKLTSWVFLHNEISAPTALSLPGSGLDELTRALPGGFYSTFRTFGGGTRAIGLPAHLQRLYGPAQHLGLTPALPVGAFRGELARLLLPYAPGEARVRIILAAQDGVLYMLIEPLTLPAPQVYREGVRVITSEAQRSQPSLKSTAFIASSAEARQQLKESGAYEGLIVREGRILEGLTSNFSYVRNGELGTASRGVLNGVTRRTVLGLARRAGIHIRYEALEVGRVGELQEAFITSSSRGIVPVVEIDGLRIGSGQPGLVAGRLMSSYEGYVRRAARPIAES